MIAFPSLTPEEAWHMPCLAAVEMLARRVEAYRQARGEAMRPVGGQTMEGLKALAQRPMYPRL